MKKEPFLFSYNRPFSDWFETVNVEINHDDYYYFKIERRFGPSWWLIGANPKQEPNYHWEYKQIGELSDRQLKRFIEWAMNERGSKIIEYKAISSDFDILKEMIKVMS